MVALPSCSEEDARTRADSPGSAAASSERTAAGEERARFFATVRAAEAAGGRGDTAAADRLWREARGLRPSHEAATLALVNLRLDAGDRDEAIALLEELRMAQPLLHRPSMLLGDLFANTGPTGEPDLDRAAARFAEAAAKEPTDTGPRLRWARVLSLRGEVRPSVEAWEAVIGTHPGNGEALRGLAEAALAEGDLDAAAAAFVRALRSGLQAEGRKDVPSEMDTRESFLAAGATAPKNVEALVGLARTARVRGGWSDADPKELRLPDLDRLGPIDPDLTVLVACAGPAVRVPAGADTDAAAILPAGPQTAPWVLEIRGRHASCRPAPALPPCSSIAALPPSDGRPGILVLGGAHASDPLAVTLVRDWRSDSPRVAASPLQGRVLAAATAGARTFALVAGRRPSGSPALWSVEGGGAGDGTTTMLAPGRFLAAIPWAGGAVALDAQGRLWRLKPSRDDQLQVADSGLTVKGAAALVAAEVSGDGLADLVLAVPARTATALQALIGERPDAEPSLVACLGDAAGGLDSTPRPLPGVPPMTLRDLAAIPAPDGGRDLLIAACGSEEPGSFSPSFALSWSGALWTATPLPSPSPAFERSHGALLLPARPPRLLLLRGGGSPGLRLPAVLHDLR